MRIARGAVDLVSGPLRIPAEDAARRWTERQGLVLRLTDELGNVGFGEASPLPGFGTDALERARATLGTEPWAAAEIDLEAPVVPQINRALAQVGPRSRSARFAVETALLDLVGQRLGKPLWALLARDVVGIAYGSTPRTLPRTPSRRVPVAALLSTGNPLEAARAAVDTGHSTLKLKIGAAVRADVSLAERVRRAVGDQVALRFDANRAYTVDAARTCIEGLAPLAPEWLEEPCPAADASAMAQSRIALALDESLADDRETALARLDSSGPWRYAVVKPTVVGGLLECVAIAREVPAVTVVVSHAYEGPVAWAACAALAVALGSTTAAGLGRHAALEALGGGFRLPPGSATDLDAWDRPGLGLEPAT